MPACRNTRLIILLSQQKYEISYAQPSSTLDHLRPLHPQLPRTLDVQAHQELGLVATGHQEFLEEEQVGDDELVDVPPAFAAELIEHSVHVLHWNRSAHEAQQPPVEEAGAGDLKLLHVGVQVVDLRVQQVVDRLTVRAEVLETMQVHHPQLLVFHHFHQCPKGEALVLDVVQ